MADSNVKESQLSEYTISTLQDIRRANDGIRTCARLLIEHLPNRDCLPGKPSAFVVFNKEIEGGLVFAIEACAARVDSAFDMHLEQLGVNWQDEWMPGIRREVEATEALDKGEIDTTEFRRRMQCQS